MKQPSGPHDRLRAPAQPDGARTTGRLPSPLPYRGGRRHAENTHRRASRRERVSGGEPESPLTDRSWILQLRPRRTAALLEAVSEEAAIREARLLIGDGAVGWAVEVACLMAAADPARADDPHPAAPRHAVRQSAAAAGVSLPSGVPDELRARSAEALALHVLTCLAGHAGDDIPEIVGVSVREFTRRGLPVGGTFDSLKKQLDCLVGELFRAAQDALGPSEAADVIRALSEALVAKVQHVLLAQAEQAENERRGWFGSAAAHRQELVLDILDGADVDAPQAFLRLGYDISRSHLALVVWRDGWESHGTADLAAAATALLRSAGCSSLLTVPVGVSSLWAWGSCARGHPGPPGRLGHHDGPHRRAASSPAVHIAAGLPGEGIEGFRTSHRQAAEAAEIVRAAGTGAGDRRSPYDYAEVELAVLLRSRPDLSAAFVRRELGPLAADGMSELRATVKCYLDTEGSMSAVADRLHIAKSSVAYRIRKAERLLGRPVREDRLRLQCALLLFDVLGRAALGGPDAGG
ncbi:helix-turn-helix domain-containing protein [Streptomyces sp. MUM 203J]|uniref:PucR family transcriptional regulator n=1 Tax=Streptomyces sp. MUM 203J TaxID=2791990 RepID=UPI001F03C64E|nr:helix-turn-helix domain-containing protein [Streptomyces sp. MUM 203J]MCH0540330.1 helix-turn-helix domain-containing protein [Streptomyces sp. MUM 203J]